ncbi:DNA polymerase delta subunit 4, putative [Eimeria mitis]|uniref:DNA polymerase delta subunit 4, putative n=1 Tax=Eimeria mitis TaxID=44415 RepID=U6JY05_9EIME|nr:DNA polymerase delta subunit 4, putative [Eimeria mitis]CDJ30340.1 DNA polymerase delta subunit 4, putative [Eimeria mitis]
MALKKAPVAPSNISDEDVIEVSRPCRFPQHEIHEMRTPRSRPRSPSEPRTPSKDSASKPFTLGSPLVTPKLDRRKTKHRVPPPSTAATAATATAAAAAAAGAAATTQEPKATAPISPRKYCRPEAFASSGYTEKELKSTADAVMKGDPRLKWYSAEADETEQLLRRFDMEAMYGPSVGVSREERWIRAAEMGLNPPAAVMEALQRHRKSSLSVFDQRMKPENNSA